MTYNETNPCRKVREYCQTLFIDTISVFIKHIYTGQSQLWTTYWLINIGCKRKSNSLRNIEKTISEISKYEKELCSIGSSHTKFLVLITNMKLTNLANVVVSGKKMFGLAVLSMWSSCRWLFNRWNNDKSTAYQFQPDVSLQNKFAAWSRL